MLGKIILLNLKCGLVLFEDEIGDYGYFEVLGAGEFEPGEIIVGDLHSLGSQIIVNQTKSEKIDVFIEDYGMSFHKAKEIVFRK